MVAPSKLSQVFSYQSWVHAVSGAAGGCIAMSMFYPLDTVRSRLQLEDPEKKVGTRTITRVMKDIITNEGYQSLYRGLGPVLQSLCISNFVYFYTFHSLKAITSGASGNQQSALKDLFLGSIAGIINVLTTTPFWVVNTRLRMRNVAGHSCSEDDELNNHYNNLVDGLKYVAKTEGVRGLWSGTIASLVLVSNPALQFMMYEFIKRHVIRFAGTEISSLGYFWIGAMAKFFATFFTYPLQLVQTIQRHRTKAENDNNTKSADNNIHRSNKPKQNHQQDIGVFEILLGILKQNGPEGLFRGMEAKLLQTVLTAALMFMAYEKISSLVGSIFLKKAPGNLGMRMK